MKNILLLIAACLITISGYAQKQTIDNGDRGSVVRSKINENFTELYDRPDSTYNDTTFMKVAEAIDADSLITARMSLTTFNSKTDNYTLVLSDAGKTIKVTAATAKTITIPLNATVAYPVGTYINISSLGAGVVTVAITATGTLTSNDDKVDIIEDGMVTVLKTDTNSWHLFGGLE